MQTPLIPQIGIFIVLIAFIATVMALGLSSRIDTKKRVFNVIAAALWAVVYISLEWILAVSSGYGNVVGSDVMFVAASICLCLGGVSSIASRARCLFEEPNAPKKALIDENAARGGDAESAEKAAPDEDTIPATSDDKLQPLYQGFKDVIAWVVPLVALGGASILSFLFLEMPSNTTVRLIENDCLTCEMTVLAGLVVGMWLIFQRRPVGIIIPMALSLLYGIAEYFFEAFKGSAITPSDLRSTTTGLNVAGSYVYEITTALLIVIGLFAFAAGLFVWLKDPMARFLARKSDVAITKDVPYLTKQVATAAISVVLGVLCIALPISSALNTDWKEEGLTFDWWFLDASVNNYGLIPSFIAILQLEDMDPPEGFEQSEAEELQAGLAQLYDDYIEESPERQAASAQFDETKPNVILIMNESFSDLSFLNGLGVGYEGPQYLNNMNALAKGKTSVSVHGAGTCNSEFESLTGISLGYVGDGPYPYVAYDLKNLDSIPKQFKALGYETVAIHPEDPTNWSRDSVYPAIGFDKFIDMSYFTEGEAVRGHVRDSDTYTMALKQIVESDEPQFIFDLTMMGHGGYNTGLIPPEENVGYDFTGIIDDADLADGTNEYLSTFRMSDQDIQGLVTQLQALDEPTVVVFFGDHQPRISSELMNIFFDDPGALESLELLRQTDYFIWANYDIAGSSWGEEQYADVGVAPRDGSTYPLKGDDQVLYGGVLPPANLMGWAMNIIGVPLTEYDKANYMSRVWIPANNTSGYLDATGVWHPMSDAEEVAGSETFTEGMEIIDTSLADGLPDPDGLLMNVLAAQPLDPAVPESAPRLEQDAVMVNVMKWLTFINYAELLK